MYSVAWVVDIGPSTWHDVTMSSSSPSDLATTYRSVKRRRTEAQGRVDSSVIAAPSAALDALLGQAAATIGSSSDPSAIADAIGAVPADGWDDSVLDSLRHNALEIGRVLRQIEDIAQAAAD